MPHLDLRRGGWRAFSCGIMRGGYAFTFGGAALVALPSGALWWPAERLLAVADLHLGKSERMARRGGPLLPPYEGAETLARLEADLAACDAARVVCVGDGFDDNAVELDGDEIDWIARMAKGRDWTWIAGNHDPAAMTCAGHHMPELRHGPLTFRHIASASAQAEVSGHYHPKLRLAGQSRRCFLVARSRVILPAYGAYTGGLSSADPVLASLMDGAGIAILTGQACHPVPLSRPGGKG